LKALLYEQTEVVMECAAYDAHAVKPEHSPLPREKQVSNDPTTGSVDLGETDKLMTGVWEHSVGVSVDVEADEVFVILSGKGRVHVDGKVLELAPGVVGTLYAGASTRWEVDETIRKVYVMPR
jgi:uncharacterized protein